MEDEDDENYDMQAEYQTIKYKINEIKNLNTETYNYKMNQRMLPSKEENVPATIGQVININNEEPTLYCKNSEILSNKNFFIRKSDCNVFNIWMPISELMNNVGATDLLSSLGLPMNTPLISDKNSFLEFKCEINNINLVSGENMGLAA